MQHNSIAIRKSSPKVLRVSEEECIPIKAYIKTKDASEQPNWSDALKQRFTGASRPCRHRLTGRINAPKICIYNYECYHCPYDQMLDEQDFMHTPEASPYNIASDYKFADGLYC